MSIRSHGEVRDHGDGHAGHSHGVSANADRRWLGVALTLIIGFMAAEVVVGVVAGSLALISDAGHMLTDAASIVLALVALRLSARPAGGGYTYGLKRAEILSAQVNGITLLLLAVYFGYEGVRRLISPPQVTGGLVLVTALVGIAVNIAASWSISRANRTSLNVEGAYQHILNDLYAFIATAVAGAVIWWFGFARADAIAALVVAALMVHAGWGLVRAAGKILLEAAPDNVDPDAVGREIVALPDVLEVHDLHIWQITSEQAALSAHVLVEPMADCHRIRMQIERILHGEHRIDHTTLQVDHAAGTSATSVGAGSADNHHAGAPHPDAHCSAPHGTTFRA